MALAKKFWLGADVSAARKKVSLAIASRWRSFRLAEELLFKALLFYIPPVAAEVFSKMLNLNIRKHFVQVQLRTVQ